MTQLTQPGQTAQPDCEEHPGSTAQSGSSGQPEQTLQFGPSAPVDGPSHVIEDDFAQSSYTALIDLRLRAIAQVREVEPRRACFGEWLQDLEHSLSRIPRHSVHYKPTVQRLLEAHEEWIELEERSRAAQEIIRSTQWLVSLLADPHAENFAQREVATGHETG